jgi:hypothetical protein
MSATLTPAMASQRTPAVRVRPAPRSEPPSDDERRAADLQAPPMAAPALPLGMPTRRRRPSPRRAGQTRPVAGAASTHAREMADPRPAAGPPAISPARLATRRFLAVCVEVLGGFRPVTQLRALCLPERFDEITQRLRAHTPGAVPGSRATASSPVPRRAPTGAPPRPGRAGQSGAERVTVRRVQVCEPIDGVAEVAAVLARRDHVWAMAVRLERRQDRWLCAHLEVI